MDYEELNCQLARLHVRIGRLEKLIQSIIADLAVWKREAGEIENTLAASLAAGVRTLPDRPER